MKDNDFIFSRTEEERKEIEYILRERAKLSEFDNNLVSFINNMDLKTEAVYDLFNSNHNISEILEDIKYANKKLEKINKSFKKGLKNNKYTEDEQRQAKDILEIYSFWNRVLKSGEFKEEHILKFVKGYGIDEEFINNNDPIELYNFIDMLDLTLSKNAVRILNDKQLERFKEAYNTYKQELIKNDLVFIERTPTVKTSNVLHLPTGKFKRLDLMVNSGDIFQSETIQNQIKNKNMIIQDEKALNLRIEKIDNNIRLDFFDNIVYISVCELYREGNNKISIDKIYDFMSGGRVSKDMALLIDSSMKRLSGIRIEAEDTDQVIKIGGALINFKGVQTEPKNKKAKITNVYYIQEEPFYLDYEKNIGRFRPIYKKWVDIRHTKQIIELEWALAWEIATRINMAGNNKDFLKINIDNLLETIGVVSTGDKKRDIKYRNRYIDDIEDFLEQHTYLGNIISYSEYPERPIEYKEKEIKTGKPIKTKAYLKGYNITVSSENEIKQLKCKKDK